MSRHRDNTNNNQQMKTLSNFTCSISKLLLSMLRFDICDDESTSINPPLSLYEFDTS
ncbi:hypothetical protein MTR_1g037400 [Medicago truncatula]|uniref:Uncharacterized protein n=1 Tax=Medicago truncatula TaxID=3880 RepID=A0A072VS33_MEDTR|nr:hypothetical protein MTR_1g037400 [Medicago truncatula]